MCPAYGVHMVSVPPSSHLLGPGAGCPLSCRKLCGITANCLMLTVAFHNCIICSALVAHKLCHRAMLMVLAIHLQTRPSNHCGWSVPLCSPGQYQWPPTSGSEMPNTWNGSIIKSCSCVLLLATSGCLPCRLLGMLRRSIC